MDSSLTYKLELGSIYVMAHTNNVTLNIGEYVNLNVYPRKTTGSEKNVAINVNGTTVKSLEDAIKIGGVASDKLNSNLTYSYEGVKPILGYGEDMEGFLVKKDNEFYIAEFGKRYTSDENPSVYYIKEMAATKTHCYTSNFSINMYQSYDELVKDYTVLQTIPEEYSGRSYLSVKNGKVSVTSFERQGWTTLSGLCTKNGVKYGYNYNEPYNYNSEEEENDEESYYELYNLSNLSGGFYDSENEYYMLTSESAYRNFFDNPIKITDEGAKDTQLYNATGTTYCEDLTTDGYSVGIENTYYKHEILNDPLVVKAKAKPAALINIASDSITKTVGEAAFSLGATTDAGASLKYESDNAAVATVAADGQVTVVGAGTAKITITAEGKDFTTSTKVVTITVNAKPEEKTVDKGASTTDEKTGATYTVTESTDGKVEVEYKASTTSKDKKVTIPSTVTVNGVEATVTSIADDAFSGNKTMTDVTIPETVEDIGDNAFKNCTKLKKVTLPASVDEVGKNAFYGCSSLTTVTIKSTTITKIDQGAFKNCKKLTKITITKNVTTIGKDAFSGDAKLKTVTIKSTKLKSVGKNAFKGVPKTTTIKVPKKQKKAYTKLLKKAGFKGKVK